MIRVTCAIIRNEDNEVLVVQRGEKSDHPFKWEFPGGKVEKGESDDEAIIREIGEELSIDIVICSRLDECIHDYGKKKINLVPFVCDTLDEMPVLAEHNAFRWVKHDELLEVDFCEADVEVARNYLNSYTVQEPAESKADQPGNEGDSDDTELKDMVNNMMSAREADWVATSAAANPALFRKLLFYSFSDDKKLAFRASWTLSKVCDKLPEIIYPYLPGIVGRIDSVAIESAQRSLLRIISFSDLSRLERKEQGIIADHCFRMLRSGFSAIAIKAYSMEALYKLALLYPDLANELSATINLIQGEGSAGIISRGRMILKKIAEISGDPGSSHS
jgi:8-oxo-dGTP diphosphatase